MSVCVKLISLRSSAGVHFAILIGSFWDEEADSAEWWACSGVFGADLAHSLLAWRIASSLSLAVNIRAIRQETWWAVRSTNLTAASDAFRRSDSGRKLKMRHAFSKCDASSRGQWPSLVKFAAGRSRAD